MMAGSLLGDCHDTDQTAKLNSFNLMAYLAEVLERIVSDRTKRNELHTLLPWNWTASTSATITNQAR